MRNLYKSYRFLPVQFLLLFGGGYTTFSTQHDRILSFKGKGRYRELQR